MILIADSGSTKTDWTLIHSPYPMQWDVVATFKTQGITPVHQTADDIRQILGHELMSQISTFPRTSLIKSGALEKPLLEQIDVFFYGSGCTPAHVPMMKQLLAEVFPYRGIDVYSDLMAAARALCQHEPGIACILGTGANSCLYDGEQIVQNTPALGYILGDEGSGSVLGRLFMNAIFKNPQFADLRDAYLAETRLTQAAIINKVYREPMANRFLASTSLFIEQHRDNSLLHDLIVRNFRDFLTHNIVPYTTTPQALTSNPKDLPVSFVGSMAFHYESELRVAAQLEGFTIGKIMQSPMEGLITFHMS